MEQRRIDGIDIVFQLAPGSEAPAEMIMYFPQLRVLDMAEDVTHNMHHLYTVRGAEVRGQARVAELLKKQRDLYKFINDQTLRLPASKAATRP